jgi:hypothetical protein
MNIIIGGTHHSPFTKGELCITSVSTVSFIDDLPRDIVEEEAAPIFPGGYAKLSSKKEEKLFLGGGM